MRYYILSYDYSVMGGPGGAEKRMEVFETEEKLIDKVCSMKHAPRNKNLKVEEVEVISSYEPKINMVLEKVWRTDFYSKK